LEQSLLDRCLVFADGFDVPAVAPREMSAVVTRRNAKSYGLREKQQYRVFDWLNSVIVKLE
jgi:hypothetical protein